MARVAPRPVGSGAEMWKASAVSAAPTTSAWMVAPRARACSADSSTTTPAPSPNRNPSRSRSNGREACAGSSLRLDSAPMLASAAKATGSSGASEPPARTTSTSPRWIIRRPSRNAMTELAQAATWVMTGPVRPYSMDSWQAAIEPDSAGMANGLTWPGPLALSVAVPSMTCSWPPPDGVDGDRDPVALLGRPVAEVEAGVRARPPCRRPCPRWMKRLMRRAILRSMAIVGSKSLTSAAMRTS